MLMIQRRITIQPTIQSHTFTTLLRTRTVDDHAHEYNRESEVNDIEVLNVRRSCRVSDQVVRPGSVGVGSVDGDAR